MEKDVVIFTCVDGRLFQRAMGAYQMAYYLRSYGYTVQVVDFTNEFNPEELDRIMELYVGPTTLAIGVSTTFFSELERRFISAKKTFNAMIPENLERVLIAARKKYPVKVVFGGSRSLSAVDLPYVDCVIHGYGEDKFLSYLDKLKADKAQIEQIVIKDDPIDKKFDIMELAHAFDPSDFIQPGETLPIEISRGCIFKCKFCAYPMNGKKKMDFLRNPTTIIDEIKHNYEHYGSTNYFIGDDTFNDSTFKLENLANELAKLPFKIKFTCYLRLDLLNAHREQIPMLYEMGLASPFFGIESLNQKSATIIGKGMDVEKVKNFLIELHDEHWKGELPFTCSFIVGLPHETEETVRDTFEWCKTAPISSVFFPLSISVQSFYQSEFQMNYASYGYILRDRNIGTWRNNNFTTETATALAEEFNKELMYTRDMPSSWFLMTLLNHGMTLEEARTTHVKDLNWNKILRARHRKVENYKRQLLNLDK